MRLRKTGANGFFVTAEWPIARRLWADTLAHDVMQDIIPPLRSYAFYQCRHLVRHVHGIMRTGVTCTIMVTFLRFTVTCRVNPHAQILSN
jgi:hypothetical protein